MDAILKEDTRGGFGKALVKYAGTNESIVSLDCDLGKSTRSYSISEVDAGRFYEMGIAEQDMISTAAGMASMGATVFASTFALFLTGRGYDQIRQQVALPKMNVKLCGPIIQEVNKAAVSLEEKGINVATALVVEKIYRRDKWKLNKQPSGNWKQEKKLLCLH